MQCEGYNISGKRCPFFCTENYCKKHRFQEKIVKVPEFIITKKIRRNEYGQWETVYYETNSSKKVFYTPKEKQNLI